MNRVIRPDTIARLARAANCEVAWKGPRSLFRAKLSGFTYSDFNRSGHVSLSSVVRTMETERSLFFRFPQYNFKTFLGINEDMIVLGNHVTMSDSLYEKASFNLPMTLEMSLLHFGNTSVDSKIAIIDDRTGDEFASSIRRLVCIDVKTSRPTAIPDAWKDVVAPDWAQTSSVPAFKPFDPFKPPKKQFRQKVLVQHDDTDYLAHTNQASYTRYAENCAAVASKAGFFDNFKGDICFYPVRKLSVAYAGESFPGDELEISTWQDGMDADTVYFHVSKHGKDVCYLKMDFISFL
ncbi:hypothetical protein CAPTEDRAFT_219915 [Capitella teleta]|uniref:Acyl-ACP thioesterase n=1 Tax=Capitella teleta TaxID=283909 RepID=R7VHA2_CAPTE|nr:hypothetical protein CAPTEDRAFT_219915 [Capitella teleta]|eukprot:ELU18193.1 hypothetical protein CAPTEDRAFT_219915 [Capitella teleta]